MQLIYRGIHYSLTSSTTLEVSTERVVGTYRGTKLEIEQPVPRSLPETTVILRYRGNDYLKWVVA